MHLLFLPGAGGAAEFWHPLGALLQATWHKTYLSWPGLGNQPHDAAIASFDDLVALAAQKITGPTVVIAQSMGGIVGVRLALRYPEKVTHLVLAATSGGVDMKHLGGEDWRAAYRAAYPQAASWITLEKPDHTEDIQKIDCPVLLIWGDADPISPVAVGEHLHRLLPRSQLHVLSGGTHDVGREKAAQIAPLVSSYFR